MNTLINPKANPEPILWFTDVKILTVDLFFSDCHSMIEFSVGEAV